MRLIVVGLFVVHEPRTMSQPARLVGIRLMTVTRRRRGVCSVRIERVERG
jgi:hypothetical protein